MAQRMTRYVAGDGLVYDWAEPHMATITNLDGTVEVVEEHLYAKYLTINNNDNITRYKLVKEPKRGK